MYCIHFKYTVSKYSKFRDEPLCDQTTPSLIFDPKLTLRMCDDHFCSQQRIYS